MRIFPAHDFTAGLSRPAQARSSYRCDRCGETKPANAYLYIRGSRSLTCLGCQAQVEARIRNSVLGKRGLRRTKEEI